jgi:uncharacterized protein (TIGR03437 family)
MNSSKTLLVCCAASLAAPLFGAQTDAVLGRVIGQTSLSSIVQSAAPNLIEGREFNSPQSAALDLSATPPILYVSDTGNNRVLGWRDPTSFVNAAPADIVIGQKDLLSTWGNGPGTAILKGLFAPTGLVVDAHGNLYVMDAGNNRILRFPQPFEQPDALKLPDQVIGQPDYSTRTVNTGGISAGTLALNTAAGLLYGSMAFDASGNLWVTDAGNHRVLRYPVDEANPGSVLAEAGLVLGQKDFTSNSATSTINKADQFNQPSGVAFDSAGNLYVADALERVLVFRPPFSTGQSSFNFIGEVVDQTGHVVLTPPTAKTLNSPSSITVLPTNEVLVSDTLNNRVLRFPPLSQWPAAGRPSANAVIGQDSYGSGKAGVGASRLSVPAQVVASANELFVVDSGNNRVVVFPAEVPQLGSAATRVLGQLTLDYNAPNLIEGRELNALGYLPMSGATSLAIRGDLVVDKTKAVPRLYISDPGNNRVLGYCDARKAKAGDKADLVIGQPDFFHSTANGDGGTHPNDQYLWLPSGVAVDANGNLLVADTGNGRVLRFAAPCDQPQEQQSFPHANLVLGQPNFTTHNTDTNARTMGAPIGVAFTPEGYFMVSDGIFNRVLRFNKPQDGDFNNGQNASAVFGQPDFFSSGSGNVPNQMNGPRYIAVDNNGRLFVADYGNNRVLVFTDSAHAANGPQSVLQLTTSDTTTGTLKGPYGIALSTNTGDLWVAQLAESRILHYPEFSELILNQVAVGQIVTNTAISPDGTALGGLPVYPVAVALDAHDNVLSLDTGNRVALYFTQMTAVNAAHYIVGRALAPGVLASAWVKFKDTPATQASATPLPLGLAGVQLLVNNTPAPLLYAGNSGYPGVIQVNFQMPSNAPTTGWANIQVVEADTQQMWDAGSVLMAAAAPAFFTVNQQGTGQVAAQNGDDANRPDGLFTCNGPTAPPTPACPGGTRPVKRNELLILYLTGPGFQPNFPPDGTTADGAIWTDGAKPVIVIGTEKVPPDNVEYSGVAPCCVGVWQINVKVPNDNVAPGMANPIAIVYRDIPSMDRGNPATTVMVQ